MSLNSCRTCPSFVSAADADTVYLKSPNADTCTRFGRILSRPDATPIANERICQSFAGTCDSHGAPRPLPVAELIAQVAIGDPSTFGKPIDPSNRPAVCTSCEHFIPINVVQEETGWTLAMCATKGRLLFPNKYAAEAVACGVGQNGPRRTSTDGVMLLPEYDGGTPISLTTKPASFTLNDELTRHQVDPRGYVSDKSVTAEETAFGIRAWRQVNDPEGVHSPVFLPIYNGEALCGFDPRTTYGSHRPDLYLDHQGILYDLAVELFELDETPVLIGGAGTGKTEAGCWMAYLMDLPFTRISVSKGTEDWHLAGESKLVTDPETGTPITTWIDGRFTEKYDKPGVIMVDEPNLKAEIYEFLRPAFDSAKTITLDAAQGLVKKRGDTTYLMASQNPSDDPIYVGVEPMSAADMDRITPIFFGLPSDDVEREIIRKHCRDGNYLIDEAILDKIMQIANDLRALIADGALPIAWGLRAQIKVARKTQFYSMEKAYKRAVIDGMEASVVDMVLASVRSVA